jgi:hypothetical protein
MADVVQVKAPALVQTAATVAEHMETAAKPPAAAAPPHAAVSSPVDAAAAGASGAIHAKMAALSAEMAPRGPAIQQAGSAAAASLIAQDTANAARMPSIPSPPTPRVQALDHSWKLGPDQPVPGPSDPNPRFPGRDNSGRFSSGNSGSADGAAAADKALQERESATGRDIIRQQIRVAIADPKTGQPMLDPKTGGPLYRYYDGLEPVPGQPGKYTGIEVKSGTADLTRTQRIFDNTVSPETPATGNLNGEPIEVTRAIKLETPQFVPEVPAPPEPAPPEVAARVPVEAPPVAPVEPAPSAPLAGGFGGGPAEPIGPRFVHPPHWNPDLHPIGDWGDLDPEFDR